MKARSSFGRQAKERLAVTKDLTSLPIQYLYGRYSDFFDWSGNSVTHSDRLACPFRRSLLGWE